MRETASVGLSDLGGRVSWGEAITLINGYAGDPSTHFGAELAEWAYPAKMVDLLTLMAQIGNKDTSAKVMPWSASMRPTPPPTEQEVLEAQAALDDGMVFAD